MIRALVLSLSLLVGISASAYNMQDVALTVGQATMNEFKVAMNFKVGDEANYKLSMGFLPGTMKMSVLSVDANEVVLGQEIELFGQKQACEMTINPNTGETKKMVCNGKEQEAQEQGEIELVDTKEDTIKVPAGTFTCLYVKALMKKTNENVEQWVNPKLVPVMGMVKMIAPSQMGQVTIELTSFKK